MVKGDHIYVSIYPNNSSPYHHGIDCGNDTVIHYQKGYKNEKHGIILWVSMTDFAKGKEIFTWKHDKCDPPLIVVERAKRRLGETKYSLVYNNCQHFAYYCKTGNPISHQVENVQPFLGGTQGMAILDALCTSKIHTEKSLQLATDETQKYINKTLENISNFWKGNDDGDKLL